MELKVVEDISNKGSPKRFSSRSRKQKSIKCLEAIAKVKGCSIVSGSDEDGIMCMKIVIKKHEFKQMLEMIGGVRINNNTARQTSPSALALEQRLNNMRRRSSRKAEQSRGHRQSAWRPALQSIPEEL